MASFTADKKAAWAAVSSSGAVGTARDPKTGTTPLDTKWRRVQGQIARTYIADPDCFFYQAYLCSNKQYGRAVELRDQITTLIQYAEGAIYPSSATPTLPELPPDLVGTTSPEGIDESVTVLTQRAKTAASASKVGKRLTERGDEAQKLYLAGISTFVQKYFTFQTALSNVAYASPDFEPLRRIALGDIQTTTDAALSTQYKSDSAAQYAVQNAAAAASLKSVNRTPSIKTRFSYKQQFTPANVATTVSGETITFTAQSPAYCYLRVGDVFSWAGGTTSISAVGDATATLSSSVGSPANYEVVPGPLSAFALLQEECSAFLTAQDVADKSLLSYLSDISTQQKVVEVITFLASVQNALTGTSTEVIDTLQRLGIADPKAVTPISDSLRNYNPTLLGSTKSATKASLETLQREGFQLAVQRFLSSDITFLSGTADMQQLAGLFDVATQEGA